MSNIYILEPPTTGKILLKTTVGDIDIELWSKEAPKACRNFIQLCLEGYYTNTIFHRVVKGFIAQGGDPNGDGTGGESIYGEPFKDEFHQRLKFVRRGLVAMANAGRDDNGSQFFFTLAATPELQNKHTIFGKVSGNTIFNVLKLEEGLIEDERPLYPHKILRTDVLNNPFTDITPRIKEVIVDKRKRKEKKVGVKNFKLLSFGTEAEEDEEETLKVNVQLAGKGKSTHDVLDDPKLSSKTVQEAENESRESDEKQEINLEDQLEAIRKKLKADKSELKKKPPINTQLSNDSDDDDFDFNNSRAERKRKFDEIKKEIENVKREYHRNKLKKETTAVEEKVQEKEHSEMFAEYKNEYDKYKAKTKTLPKKGSGREEFTLNLLAKFKNKLQTIKEKNTDEVDAEENADDVDNDESWMSHELRFKDDVPILAKDANTKDDDWFEIYDPRNALNKRRRGENIHKEKNDPKLSSKTVQEAENESRESDEKQEINLEDQLEAIRKKLKADKSELKKKPPINTQLSNDSDDDDFDFNNSRAERKRKFDEIKKEIENVKREYHRNKLKKETTAVEEKVQEKEHSEMFAEYKNEYDKYKAKTKTLPKKGSGREEFTLNLLAKFKNKLQTIKEKNTDEVDAEENADDVDNDESW
ncbi:peptidyl-prolyl cis-trans isomerase-related [Holotrichia oblita]|uniref:Peptidyl-prolyl cis-trans isomerase-related n=1 Tax=Holotrichia oblita TaxID=644536 RepID=A0ACB9TM07_HOLOL|nr:peptidyl-prolyl cis-trans isomerase-related [Holotrichia oblita]